MEVREALAGSVQVIIDSVKATLDETPPELVADLMEYGIGKLGLRRSTLHGLAQRLQDDAHARLCGRQPADGGCDGRTILEKPEFYKETLTSMQRKSTIR